MGRRILGALVALAAALAAAGGATAAPLVQFKARAAPIPGFRNTGNIAGAGAAIEYQLGIEGHEYEGFPPPLIHLNLYLPAGVTVHPEGFPTCEPSTLEPEALGPRGCPKGSRAGPLGTADYFIAFGREVVPEQTTIESFYAPAGGVSFFIFGHDPVPFEAISKGQLVPSGAPYGRELQAAFPLIETVPGAQDASVGSITVKTGSALKRGASVISYFRLPRACPEGHLPFEAELTFAGLGGLSEQTLTAAYSAPCPLIRSPVSESPEEPVPLPGTGGVVTAPSNKTCVSKRDFRIHIVPIPHLAYRLVTVELNGKPVKVLRGKRLSARIDLRGLPKGRYVARIGVVTTTGRVITGRRTYHTCAAHAVHPRRPPRL